MSQASLAWQLHLDRAIMRCLCATGTRLMSCAILLPSTRARTNSIGSVESISILFRVFVSSDGKQCGRVSGDEDLLWPFQAGGDLAQWSMDRPIPHACQELTVRHDTAETWLHSAGLACRWLKDRLDLRFSLRGSDLAFCILPLTSGDAWVSLSIGF
jgi:hypothetical protein